MVKTLREAAMSPVSRLHRLQVPKNKKKPRPYGFDEVRAFKIDNVLGPRQLRPYCIE
jgi:hypothetical protein